MHTTSATGVGNEEDFEKTPPIPRGGISPELLTRCSAARPPSAPVILASQKSSPSLNTDNAKKKR